MRESDEKKAPALPPTAVTLSEHVEIELGAAAHLDDEKTHLAPEVHRGEEEADDDEARLHKYRSLHSEDFKIRWDINNYATPQNPSTRMTIGELLFGEKTRSVKDELGSSIPYLKTAFQPQLEDLSDDESESSSSSLHSEPGTAMPIDEEGLERTASMSRDKKLGMIQGVTLRCLFNIFGVIMFLRLPWVFGVAGIGYATLIILVANFITVTTTLSLSAIVTNGQVKSGGTYFVISRALGPEFGGPVGVLFGIANIVAVAMYLVGFAETIRDTIDVVEGSFLDQFGVQTFALAALVGVFLFSLVGIRLVSKIQSWIAFPFLVVSVFSIIIGVFLWTSLGTKPNSVPGLSTDIFLDNFGPKWGKESFFTVLSIFFPGATGIMAGANISGSLARPGKSIPKGTLMAIGISATTYLLLGWLIASSVFRENTIPPPDTNFLIMTKVSVTEYLVYIGIYASTLSQAITSFTNAPELLVSVAKDDLYPFLRFFTRGNSKVRGLIFTFLLSIVFILPGELNSIAPLITALFILAYAVINFACFLQSFTKQPGWRPAFSYYNQWYALFGTVSCVALMFVLDYISALIAVGLLLIFASYVVISKPNVNWGGAFQSIKYKECFQKLLALDSTPGHAKNYRLELLVLCGEKCEYLCDFANHYLVKGRGIMILGRVIVHNLDEFNVAESDAAIRRKNNFLTKRARKKKELGFGEAIISPSFREGARALMQTSGVSRMRPNVVLFGYPNNWMNNRDKTVEFVNSVRDAFLLNKGVMILRGFENWDFGRQNIQGRIDVWWLIDDGGLSLLVPYVIHSTRAWRKTELRVMEVCSSRAVSHEKLQMTKLLARFRINAVIQPVQFRVDPQKRLQPSEEITSMFNSLTPENKHMEMEYYNRTNRQLFMADRIREHSQDAAMVIISTPVPQVKLNPMTYMSWIECLSRDMPPTILIRGNQESVLTWEL